MTELERGGRAILKDLIYHGNRYLEIEEELAKVDRAREMLRASEIIDILNHEAIAFFNRIGQFYYYATSKAVSDNINNPKDLIPEALRILPFRHKQSAHRASDTPRDEDPFYMRMLDQLFTWGSITINDKILYQITLDDAYTINFMVNTDYPKIVAEIATFLDLLAKD